MLELLGSELSRRGSKMQKHREVGRKEYWASEPAQLDKGVGGMSTYRVSDGHPERVGMIFSLSFL